MREIRTYGSEGGEPGQTGFPTPIENRGSMRRHVKGRPRGQFRRMARRSAAEARITVRLPSYLKDLITSEAEVAGDSINSYVVDVLSSKTRTRRSTGSHTKTTLDL